MATERDYYDILQVDRTTGAADIKRAYRKKAMKYHPDRNPGDTDAEKAFRECAEAYEVLSNPEKRQRYDQYGHAGLRGTSGHDFGHMDLSDIFSIFGDFFDRGGSQGGPQRGRRGYDLETLVEVTLEEVLTGVEREIEFTRQDYCQTCSGSGSKPGSTPQTCTACGGQGQVAQAGFGGMFRMVSTCPACAGAGKVIKEKCSTCNGSGHRPKKRVIKVKIPPGIHTGQAIRIPKEGEPGREGGPRGHLHVVVKVTDHELFKREEDHLVLNMPISFTQAALGAKVHVPSLNGKQELTLSPGTQHGAVFRVPEQGLPNLQTNRSGDLIVVVTVEVPRRLTGSQEDLLRRFAETEDHKVLPHSHSFWNKIKNYLH